MTDLEKQLLNELSNTQAWLGKYIADSDMAAPAPEYIIARARKQLNKNHAILEEHGVLKGISA